MAVTTNYINNLTDNKMRIKTEPNWADNNCGSFTGVVINEEIDTTYQMSEDSNKFIQNE